MPSVIIVDDEPGARKGLRRQLVSHPDIQILGEAEDVKGACDLVLNHQPDVVFLDVEMPGATGFELLETLPQRTRVVFITAHSQYAPRAFDVEALDYLLKPVRAERLAVAVDRIRRYFSMEGGDTAEPERIPLPVKDFILLRRNKQTLVVPINQITALKADGDYTWFYLLDEPPLLMGYNLSRFEVQMPHPPFVKISRSLVVNVSHILSLDVQSRDEAKLLLRGQDVPLTLKRVAAARLKTYLEEL